MAEQIAVRPIRSFDFFTISKGVGFMELERNTERWAEQVFGGCELGDVRRTRRLMTMAAQLAAHAGEAPSRACRGDAAANEGAYRLLRNKAVAPEAIAAGGFRATAQAAQTCGGDMLAVEDTTTLAYAHSVAEELGDLGGREQSQQRGWFAHSVLLLEADSGRTLGLMEQERWCRPVAQRGQRHRRRERAYTEKESYKWQRAGERVAARLDAETLQRVIAVCDREADVYEYLQYKRAEGQRFIVRACWDRRVAAEAQHLFETLATGPVIGEQTLRLAQRGGTHGRRARQVVLELHAARVTLQAPRRAPGLGTLEVNAVLAQERDTPRRVEPLCWLLLTSEPVDSREAVCRVLRYYALRWRVEEFHKAWKSGARVEERRMQSVENLERTAVVLAFIAVRLLQLRELFDTPAVAVAETPPPLSCAGVLEQVEWQVLWVTQKRSRPPKEPPSLRWAYEAIAKLGGWLDTKRTGRAGWEAIWEGWFRLQERVDAYVATRDFLH